MEEVQHLGLPADLHEAAGELFLTGYGGGIGNRLRLRLAGNVIGVVAEHSCQTVHVLGRVFFDGDLFAGGFIDGQINGAESAGPKDSAQAVSILQKIFRITHSSPHSGAQRSACMYSIKGLYAVDLLYHFLAGGRGQTCLARQNTLLHNRCLCYYRKQISRIKTERKLQ
jgi:hypothetical protein